MKLNALQLKWIAIITMTIDHTGAVLFPGVPEFRYIGRIAFPIFCFLLVEGFFHTHNVYRYMLRLGAFALIAEIPYDLAFRQTVLEYGHENVFFTLLIGMGMMCLLERGKAVLEKGIWMLLAMWAAEVLHTDYSWKGVLLIAVFYFLREKKCLKLIAGAAWNFLWNWQIQGFGAAAMLPLALYSGEKGESLLVKRFGSKKDLAGVISKYFFYVFYPAHLLMLAFLSQIPGIGR